MHAFTEAHLKVECYARSLPQQGHATNEDAFLVIRELIPVAAVCDGAGNAEQAARRVLRLFQLFVREATAERFLSCQTWMGWVRKLDSAQLGGAESTFLRVAIVGDQGLGAAAGDSQAYLLDAEGGFQYLTTSPQKARLGSGEVKPFAFSVRLKPRDILLLMTDGAWTPLSPYLIQRAVRGVALQHFSEVPTAVLEAAGGAGRWDDMTVVALRIVGH